MPPPFPFTRPPVADLVFRAYDRPLHPELVDAVAVRRVARDGWVLTARVTPTGHLIEWVGSNGGCVTEVTATPDAPLPAAGRRLAHPVRHGQRGRFEVAGKVRYQVSVQAEVLPPERFVPAHDELAADGARRGLVFHFRPPHRLGLAPLGLVTAEPVAGGLVVTAFHTFPDEFAVVTTRSLIEPVGPPN